MWDELKEEVVNRLLHKPMRLLLAAVIGLGGCADTTAVRRKTLAAIDSLRARTDSLHPFEGTTISVNGQAVSFAFDLRCSDDGETMATITLIGTRESEAFMTTVSPPITTRVVWQVDSLSRHDERWQVGGMGSVVAYSPMPATLGQMLRGARTLKLSIWSYGGDSTEVTVDVSRAGPRLRESARNCRWPL